LKRSRRRAQRLCKTGTLTVGGARILRIETTPAWSADETLRVVGSLEQASQHPVAGAIVVAARERGLEVKTPSDVREVMRSGLEGKVSGRRVRAGSHEFVFGKPPDPWARRILRQASVRSALVVFVAVEKAPAGAIVLADQLRQDATHAIQGLRAAGVSRIVTGDRAETAESIGAALELDSVLSDRAPADKVAVVAAECTVSLTSRERATG
jgi:P-type E1-E2 ATPase